MSSQVSSPPLTTPTPTPTPTTPPPSSDPPSSDPPTPPTSEPPTSQPPDSTSQPPTSQPDTSTTTTPPTSSNPPSSDPGSTSTTTTTSTPESSVISTPVTTVIFTSVVQTSADGQVFTTVIASSSVLPPGSTIAVNPSNRSAQSSNTGAIVGGVVGGIAGLAILAIALFFLIRRHNRSKEFDFDGNFDPDRFTSGGRYVPGGGREGGTLPDVGLALANIEDEDECPVGRGGEYGGGGRGGGAGMSEVGAMGGGLGGGGNRMSLSSSGHLSSGGMNLSGEMREFGDDGMGGRLAGSTIGAGVVTPFMLSRPSQPNANASSYSNLPPGAAPSGGAGGLAPSMSVPVGGYYPSEKQRMAAHYAQQPPSPQRLPNPYDLNSSPSPHGGISGAGVGGVYPPQPYPSPPRTATTGNMSLSPPGSPTSMSHSMSTGPSAFVGGFVPQPGSQSQAGYESSESHYGTTTNTNTSADGKRYGPRLGVANPDEGEASASNVLVHRDGGRVKAAEAEAERREREEVDEIPPTYESVAGGGGRSDTPT